MNGRSVIWRELIHTSNRNVVFVIFVNDLTLLQSTCEPVLRIHRVGGGGLPQGASNSVSERKLKYIKEITQNSLNVHDLVKEGVRILSFFSLSQSQTLCQTAIGYVGSIFEYLWGEIT